MMIEEHLNWFPMRVTYDRQLRIKDHLDALGIQNFVPMKYGTGITSGGRQKIMLVPAISNLIFVRSTRTKLTWLKMMRREFQPMRYMMSHSHLGIPSTIIRVPDRQMNNFIKVASIQDDRVIYPETTNFLGKEGKKVKIIDGDFKGVFGVIKRVKGSKRVVVELDDIAAVAIAFVPSSFLQEIDTD